MAGGTINGSTGNQYIDSKIVWSSVANNDTNKSTVTAALYYKRNNTGFTTSGTGTFSISIAGINKSVTKSVNITENAWVKVVENTVTVSHDADGGKDITITASGSIPGTTMTSTTCKDTVSLDTIPRASTITSASSVMLGNACSVKWTPASASFRYKLKFTLGDWSYETGAIHPNTTAAYTYKGYKIPLDVAKQLPNAKTGTMTVTLTTYSNSAATTKVGSTSSKTFTVTVPDNSDTKPNATVALSSVHSIDGAFEGLYIQGISKVKALTSAEGKYGATVVWTSMTVEGKSYGGSSDYTSDTLSGYGTIYVKVSIKDSRGIENSKTQAITVIPYSKPRVVPVDGETSVVCGRCDSSGAWSDSGTYLKIKARRSYSLCLVNGVQKNFCGLRYRYKKVTDSEYSSWTNILNNNNLSTDEVITAPLLNGGLSTKTSYMVQVDAVDSIPNHTPMTFTIPTEEIYLHKAGSIRSLGIGTYAEESNTVRIADDIAVKTGNSINGVFMGTKVVSGVSSFDIQSKYAEFTGTGNGNERQTFFIFGSANASLVYGVARVSNSGVTAWAGTSGVTLSSKEGGILTVTLPATAYDLFTVFSSRKFTL